jgi:glycosyltransferase involved in cell wall biosynthesis
VIVLPDAAVSIIIPCFNAEATIAETIESALAQTWQAIEIIVVDDGSTDRSAEILRRFSARIRIESGPNRGASAARNSGTALASGAFIQYLDADDLLAPDAVATRIAALDKTDADVAYGDWQRFDTAADGSRRLGEAVARRIEDIDDDVETACATAFWAPPAAILYRRRIVDAIGNWNERLPVIQDARFLFDAAHLRARFIHVPGITAFYRHAASSLSRRDEGRFMRDIYRNGVEIQLLWEAEGPLTPKRKAALAGIFDMTARNFFQLGMPEFDDAVRRLNAVSGRRFAYPQVAHHMMQLAGRDAAVAAIAAAAPVVRGLRGLLGGRR